MTGPVPPGLRRSLGRPQWLVGDLSLRRTHPQAPRSYLADGRVVVWLATAPPGWSLAVDAELHGRALPDVILRRMRGSAGASGVADDTPAGAVGAWTRAEVAAKLTDVPILLWLTRIGLGRPTEDEAIARRLLISTWVSRGIVLSIGAGPDDGAGAR